MDITIQSPGFKASGTLENHIREKLNKLAEHDSKIISAEVTLYIGPKSEHDNNYCEIKLKVPGTIHFAKKNSPTFEHSVVATIEALQKEIQKDKDRDINRRRSESTLPE